MTINPQKLLPPSKLSTPAGRMSVPYDNKVDDVTNLNVKRKLINVDKFLKNSYTQKKKEEDKKKRKKQSETRQEKETKLETPKGIKTTSDRNSRNEIAILDPEFRFGMSSSDAPLIKPIIKTHKYLDLFA